MEQVMTKLNRDAKLTAKILRNVPVIAFTWKFKTAFTLLNPTKTVKFFFTAGHMRS